MSTADEQPIRPRAPGRHRTPPTIAAAAGLVVLAVLTGALQLELPAGWLAPHRSSGALAGAAATHTPHASPAAPAALHAIKSVRSH